MKQELPNIGDNSSRISMKREKYAS
jgi:hypothetical protein